MPRLYLRLVLLPLALFTAALLLIHIQPYDDHELRELLLPEDCPTPCFMGIRPGVTTVEEAVKILKSSGWVESFEYTTSQTRMGIKWNHTSPSWLDNYNGRYGGSGIWFVDGRVIAIGLDTNLTLGTLQLVFGKPPFQIADVHNIQGRDYIGYEADYTDNGLVILMFLNCDTPISYQSNVILSFQEISRSPEYQNFYNTSWNAILRTRCPTNP